MRQDGRMPGDLRPVRVQRRFQPYAEGSVLIETGDTRVICSASVEEKVPPFLKDTGRGWVTAEYSMLPRSTLTRISRDRATSGGRSSEISRLIGRALRATIDTTLLGARTITVDCDVLQADGGTRTASITGAMIALVDACDKLRRDGLVTRLPITQLVAATSVGMVNGVPSLDLNYVEDSQAHVDMNVAMLSNGEFVEVQGTAERVSFSRSDLNTMLDLAERGIRQLFVQQMHVLADVADIAAFGNRTPADRV